MPLYSCLLSLTVCQRSVDLFHIVSYYIKWVKTSWPYSILYFRIQGQTAIQIRIRIASLHWIESNAIKFRIFNIIDYLFFSSGITIRRRRLTQTLWTRLPPSWCPLSTCSTLCNRIGSPRSLVLFYIVSNYMNRAKTSWTYCNID